MRPVLVLACAVIAVSGCARAVPGTAAAPPDARPWSAEEQIAELVEEFAQAWNDNNYDDLRSMMCAEMRELAEFTDEALRDARSESGTLDLAIIELEVDGDAARSVIENHGADPDDIAFTLERGEWKWCEY